MAADAEPMVGDSCWSFVGGCKNKSALRAAEIHEGSIAASANGGSAAVLVMRAGDGCWNWAAARLALALPGACGDDLSLFIKNYWGARQAFEARSVAKSAQAQFFI